MQRGIASRGFILTVGCCLTIVAMASGGQGAPQGLKPYEFDGIALIYNQELSALGNRALFPICIGMPSVMPTEALIRYLRKNGFEISDEAVCEPGMAPGGQHHPKDYSHGLRIFFDKLQRDSAGVISIRVQADDLTVRPGEHFGQMLRRGTYQLKQDQAGKWQIADYTKEYDSADEKGQDKCDCAQPSRPAGCSLTTLSSPDPVFPAASKPVPMQTPIAELSITEDGAVRKVRLLRSSNQQSWDRVILKTLKTWRFSKAPGCGLRKTKASIDIHVQ